jgi:hypothetical protein
MPTFDDYYVSVSGQLFHESDFAFDKKNGELANRLRKELASVIKEISLDTDGDVKILTDRGTFYASSIGVVAGGWVTPVKELSASHSTEEFAHLFDSLASAKGSFKSKSFRVSVFFRFTPEDGLRIIGERGLQGALRLILGDKTPSEVNSYRISSEYDKGGFLDFVELESSDTAVQLRYSRTSKELEYESYKTFLDAADIAGLVEDLKPFADALLSAQSTPPLGRISSVGRIKQAK